MKKDSNATGSRYWVSGYPRLVREWDGDRNGTLSPGAVSGGSGQMIWWRCPQGPDHRWRATPNNRTRGAGCPFCANRRVSVTNSLATRFPRVAAEWHPSKNGTLKPRHVVAASARVVWWRCSVRPEDEWRASVRDRTRAQTACPYCSGRRPSPENSLASRHPALAAEWHPRRNGVLSPSEVLPGSNRPVWWRCSVRRAHAWRATVDNRAYRASGCPHCARRARRATGKTPDVGADP